MKLNGRVVLTLLSILAITIMACAFGQDAKEPETIELTKAESLALIRLQMQVETAVDARNRFVLELFDKYEVTEATHRTDILNGRLVPAPKIEDQFDFSVPYPASVPDPEEDEQ